MKKILCGALTGFALFLITGCAPRTPTVVSSTNEQKETIISTSETSSSVQQEATTTSKKTSVAAIPSEKVATVFEKEHPKAKITSLQLDTDFGRHFYEIEGVDQQKEYRAEVNAETDELTKERVGTLGAGEQNGVKIQEETLDLINIISREQATALAEEAAKVGQATDWKLEKELGITYWEMKMKEGQQKIEIKIDAHFGKVLTTERGDQRVKSSWHAFGWELIPLNTDQLFFCSFDKRAFLESLW